LVNLKFWLAIFQQHFSPIVWRRWAIFHFHRSSKNSNKVKVSWIHKKDQNFRLTNFIFLNICLNLYLYDGIFIHLYDIPFGEFKEKRSEYIA
jgi:hypothetical protein